MSAASLPTNDLPDAAFLRQPQVLAMIPVSSPTLWRMVKAKKFPAPYKLAPNVTAWKAEDVKRWCDGLRPTAT
jgi:prophage regulatory protein